MMKDKRICALTWMALSALMGAGAALARCWQLDTGFEGALSLPIRMAPASICLTAILVLSAAVLALLALRQPVVANMKEEGLVPFAPGDTTFMTGAAAAGFLSLLAVPVLFGRGRQLWATYQLARQHSGSVPGGNNGVLTLLTACTALLAFLGLLMGGRAVYRGMKGGSVLLLPAVNSCLWLMEVYRGHAADPVRWDYAPLLLAIVCGLLFYLDWAGMFSGSIHPRRTLWLGGMTIVFSAAALAGEWEWQDALLLCTQLVAALTVLWHMPQYTEDPPVPVQEEPEEKAEEKLEEEPHE